jgi:hypothetical protein
MPLGQLTAASLRDGRTRCEDPTGRGCGLLRVPAGVGSATDYWQMSAQLLTVQVLTELAAAMAKPGVD